MRFLGAVLAAGVATGVQAQDCPYVPLMVEMADHVLAERSQLNRFATARYGDTAAFVLATYAGRDAADLFADIAAAEGRPPRYLDDLRVAYAITQPNGLDAWQQPDPDRLRRLIGAQWATRRALLLADEGETYYRLWAAVQADEVLRQDTEFTILAMSMQAAFLVVDQPVDVRMRLAQRAEAAGALWDAAALLGDLADRAPLEAFLARHPQIGGLDADMVRGQLAASTVGAMNGPGPLRARDTLDGRIWELQLYTVLGAALSGPPSDFLSIYLNQTGKTEAISRAAQSYLFDVNAGAFDPVADPEAAWLAIYAALLAFDPQPASVRQGLSGFSWPQTGVRSYAGMAIESLDVMVAKDALGPFVRGETRDLPGVPTPAPETIDWVLWTDVANAVAVGNLTVASEDRRPILFELLWEGGAYAEAVEVAVGAPEVENQLAFLRDGLGRLDALCDQRLTIPGGAVRFGGQPVYQFD